MHISVGSDLDPFSLFVPLQASSLAGWDVVSPDECLLSNATWRLLTGQSRGQSPLGARFQIRAGQVLQQRDKPCRQFFVLLEVSHCKHALSSLLLNYMQCT